MYLNKGLNMIIYYVYVFNGISKRIAYRTENKEKAEKIKKNLEKTLIYKDIWIKREFLCKKYW